MTEKRRPREVNLAFGGPAETAEDHAERVVPVDVVRGKFDAFSERRGRGFGIAGFGQRRAEPELRVGRPRLKRGRRLSATLRATRE